MRAQAGDLNVQGEWFFTKQERTPTQQQPVTAMVVRPPMPVLDGPWQRVDSNPGFIYTATPQTFEPLSSIQENVVYDRKPGQPSLPALLW